MTEPLLSFPECLNTQWCRSRHRAVFVEELANRTNTTVYAGVRDTALSADHPSAQHTANSLTVVIPLKVSLADEEDNLSAAADLRAKLGGVDVIIANANEHWDWLRSNCILTIREFPLAYNQLRPCLLLPLKRTLRSIR